MIRARTAVSATAELHHILGHDPHTCTALVESAVCEAIWLMLGCYGELMSQALQAD